jgi:hypothetical protein
VGTGASKGEDSGIKIHGNKTNDEGTTSTSWLVELTGVLSHLLQEPESPEIEMIPNPAYYLDNPINAQLLNLHKCKAADFFVVRTRRYLTGFY